MKQFTLPNRRGASVGETNKEPQNTHSKNQPKTDETVLMKTQMSPKYKPSSSENQPLSLTFKYEEHVNNFFRDDNAELFQRRGLNFSNGYLDTRKFPSLSRVPNNPVKIGQKKKSLLDDLDRVRVRVLVISPSNNDSERSDKVDSSQGLTQTQTHRCRRSGQADSNKRPIH